ncbi:G2/mitotic-specific cyclin-2-like isoform X2 [Henckelia pumila]|uniref:G2/mitotic-specific cyclin-2-like isoform X2 n=1 Tax=Henckelia pumila TaxID=405737 RepID=UPI003C6E998F
MATRQVILPKNRGAIKQKNIVAERKNRRALGDIGNVVAACGVNGKPLPQVSRPATRSFCAQLLANAQAAAAEKNSLAVNGNAAIVADGALPHKRPVQKKDVTKPNPEEIIEISPDTEEVHVKQNPPQVVNVEELVEKSHHKSSSRKQAPTLTSTLTARSQSAYGLNEKHKEDIVDIDAADVNNDLAVVEYVEDMYSYYKSAENESRPHAYMDTQPEINEKMRAILIDWLIQVHYKFELSPETLYLTINILDRYLSATTTSRRELQLVGMSAMLIASKYEEIWAPEVNELVGMSDNTYSHKQVLLMEKRILGELEWNLTVPTPYVFLVRFIKASMTDSDVENMVYFLAELGMMNYATLMYCPSVIAASAVYAARSTLNKMPLWNETLRKHTGFSEPQLMDCAKLLVSFHLAAAENKLKGIYRKYTNMERKAVALLPPAKSLLVADLEEKNIC